MPKREQIVTLPTVPDPPSDNPRPILVEFISGFVSFAKIINTPGTRAQRRNSAWICTLMKRSGKLLQENVITESWLSSPESLWLLKRSTISHAIAISAPEISQSLGIRKKTASIPNISKPNCRDMTTLEPICYQNLRILRLSELYALSTSFVNSQGEREMQNRITSRYSAKSLQPRPSRSFLSIVWKSGLLWSTGLGSATSERTAKNSISNVIRQM